MTFGQRLKREIENALLTKEQFAEKAGVPFGTLQTWLYTDHLPRGTNVVRIANALGVSRRRVESWMKQAAAA